MGLSFGPFWSAKYLYFGGESCEIKILSLSIHETCTLRKMKNQVFTFSIELRINLGSLQVQILFVECQRFALSRISGGSSGWK